MISDMLQDHSGGTSTMRVAVLIIVLTVMGTEASYAIRNNVRLDMEGSGITLILGSLGLKAAQRAAEKEQPTTP